MAIIDKFRIGTRGSALALAQTGQVIDKLKAKHSALQEPGATSLVVIKTTGDREQSRLLAEIGGKGLFTKELDEAMLRGDIDLAIHSMKDMPTYLPEGIVLHAITERVDARDAFISSKAKNIAELPEGATVGTASLRRKSQLLNLRPDLRVVPFRGNVDTRLQKLADGEVDATLLAYAGLKRMGKEDAVTSLIDIDQMLPAVGQGVLAATCREDDRRANTLIAALAHPPTTAAVLAERAMLAVLDGSCQTPIAGWAQLDGAGNLTLRGIIARPDGAEKAEVSLSGPSSEAEQIGTRVAERLILEAGPSILDAIKQDGPSIIRPHTEMERSKNTLGDVIEDS
jgi:hydroxymethylbilane synthase